MLRVTTLLALGLLTCTVSQADVYKYTDKNGQVQYTDKPELLPAELLTKIKSQRTDNSAIADRVAADLKARDAAAKAQQANTESAADKQKAADITAADKADRCTRARARYESVTTTGRVYSLDANGQRVYMDNNQLDQTRAAAQEQMDTWCN
ncbi:MAG: DUF4124 domain-containing protein [Steroidobacteraceae bacterium]